VPDKGMGVQVPPRTHRDHPLTCESVTGYGFGNVVSGQFLQVRAMGGQVGPRSQNDNGFAARPGRPSRAQARGDRITAMADAAAEARMGTQSRRA
jgi:hypothetical protein